MNKSSVTERNKETCFDRALKSAFWWTSAVSNWQQVFNSFYRIHIIQRQIVTRWFVAVNSLFIDVYSTWRWWNAGSDSLHDCRNCNGNEHDGTICSTSCMFYHRKEVAVWSCLYYEWPLDLSCSAALLQNVLFFLSAGSMSVHTVSLKPQTSALTCCGKKFLIDKPWVSIYLFIIFLKRCFSFHFPALFFGHISTSRAAVEGRLCVRGPCSPPPGLLWSCLELVLSKALAVGSSESWIALHVCACSHPPVCLGTPSPLSFSPYCLNSNARPTWRIPHPPAPRPTPPWNQTPAP